MIKTSFTTLALFTASTAFAADIELIHSFDSEIYTEAQPVKSFLDEFDHPLTSGDSAFTYNIFELGVKYKGVSLGAQSRYNYVLEFDPDTALFTYLEKNDLPFEKRDYRYLLKGKQSTTHGVFLAYDIDVLGHGLTITPKITYYQSAHFQDAVVDGTVFSDEIKGALETEYYFSRDILFKTFTPEERPQGKGYSFDLAINWQVTEDLFVSLRGLDIVNETKYEGAGFVNGFTTDVPFTEQGDSIVTEPSIRLRTSAFGQEIEYSFEHDARYYFDVSYRYNNQFSFDLFTRFFNNDTFVQGNVNYYFNDDWKVFTGYETHSKAVEVGIANKYFGASIKTDKLDLDDAYYANVNWFLKLAF
ncbi:hypothetical protein [Pseudoalteromonas luteoviolacea]|uniref:Porin domain-containing protein n=1 Tax=Pseudoalteromonas luteoviolacea DSM 6061 TaxID=1365250 RepID=A0A162A2W8_9GAMM|nr:hypothetical protein [Pseudoalteromonas luteoviolacea]KZN43039.1 hypothetical protein N475_00230 [Pseudoalteromonas luteoviolacea DSM 6061]KZN55403.1 hypothetical protein N474_15610 [Pseudoalteromonas luteoviolacea CPMOR-2]MBE0385546.1 hypothetical protein [Pseudoalteromonas luteoviolacea DSM 6061]TQF70548.1 hypothetical protein FLM44_05490 [Pseudoalteromonas luteoviolacea]